MARLRHGRSRVLFSPAAARSKSSRRPLRAPVRIDHIDRPPGGKNRPFLPGTDMTEMLPGEVEGAVRLVEQCVVAVLVRSVTRGDAEAVRHLRPNDRHRLFKLP